MPMRFSELVRAAMQYLQESGRLTYRALQREFDLDAETLADLVSELIDARRVARDEDGKVLVWLGEAASTPAGTPQELASATTAASDKTPRETLVPADVAAAEVHEERKTITVLFVDIKGSTAMIDGLDPEEARAVIDPALQLMIDAVHAYGGHVAQALGDGIFALFGAPIAHEDHAQRAVHAALTMQASLRAYSDRLRRSHGFPLDPRIGINTGDVVVRAIRKDDRHTDYVPVGHAVNVASRAEQLASPGAIVLTEFTEALVAGFFDLRALGPVPMKGVEAPVALFQVQGTRAQATRLQVAAQRGLSAFVGREAQLAQLLAAYQRAEEGQGQVIAVVGEPGLGKSRLLYEFRAALPASVRVRELQAVAYAQGLPYFPLIEMLRARFPAVREDPAVRGPRLAAEILAQGRGLEDAVPYLLSLLDEELATRDLLQMDAQVCRRRTHEALRRLVLAEAQREPVVMVCEDLHWIDPETQAVLDAVVEQLGGSRLLLVTTYRPEYRHEWSGKSTYDQVRLAPLRTEDGQRLLEHLLGPDPRLDTLKRQVLDLTGGTPFFIEEVVQALVEHGSLEGHRGSYRALTAATLSRIPPTVQGVLAARIDRLPTTEKAVLLELSVIGRECPLAIVRRVGRRAEHELELALGALQKREFVYPKFDDSDPTLMFKHALTQEVAYQSLLLSHRRELHDRVGEAIEALHPHDLERWVPTLAHHFGHGTNDAKAIAYYRRAAQQASRRGAAREALHSLDLALARVARMPASRARDEQELELRLARGGPLLVLEGLASPVAEKLYADVYDAATAAGLDDLARVAALGISMPLMQSGRIREALALLDDAARREELRPTGHGRLALLAYRGTVAHFKGDLVESSRDLNEAIVRYRDTRNAQDRDVLIDVGWTDYGINAYGILSKTAWLMGAFDESLSDAQHALETADRLAHPHGQAFALYANMVLQCYRRDFATLADLAARASALCEAHGVTLFHAWGVFFGARADAATGDVDGGLAGMRRAVAHFEGLGSRLLRPYCLGQIAEIEIAAGRFDAARDSVREGLGFAEATGEHTHLAVLYRLQGELALSGPSPDAVTAGRHFEAAFADAAARGARWLGLQALLSLARLQLSHGTSPDAVDRLGACLSQMNDSPDVVELAEARALLAQAGC
ncbi:MAG: AAA family ATPase [Gammaproteobacteria bacterium]